MKPVLLLLLTLLLNLPASTPPAAKGGFQLFDESSVFGGENDVCFDYISENLSAQKKNVRITIPTPRQKATRFFSAGVRL